MFEAQLFLGVEIDDNLSNMLAKANPRLLELLIQNEPIYLQRASCQRKDYLGKYVGDLISLSQLELIELNIMSLLKKISPEYTPQPFSLVLFSSLKAHSLSDSK